MNEQKPRGCSEEAHQPNIIYQQSSGDYLSTDGTRSNNNNDLPEELDVNNECHDHESNSYRQPLLQTSLKSKLSRAPFKARGLLQQIFADVLNIIKFFASVEDIVNIFLHDRLNFAKIIIKF